MIAIFLLSLFATAFSSTCKEQFYSIDTIVINEEVFDYSDSCIKPQLLCNRFKFDGHTLISLDDYCDDTNIYDIRLTLYQPNAHA